MTVSRLYIRRGRYWWDDAWVFFSLINLFIQFAAVFMHVEDPSEISRTSRIAAYYLMAVTFYTIIWSARLAILYSIIRLDPDPVMRYRLKWVAGVFVAAIFFFFAQLMWVCEPEPGWKDARSPQCRLNKEVAICQVVSDVISDLLLITLPIRLIRGIRDRGLQRRLMLIFSTSIVTTVVSLAHAYYIITDGEIPVVISALVEDCMSLTVANLPVTATALLRMFGVYGESDRDDSYADGSTGGPRFKHTSFGFKTRFTSVFGVSTGRHRGHGTTFGATTGYGGQTTIGTDETEPTTATPFKVGALDCTGQGATRTVEFQLGERMPMSADMDRKGLLGPMPETPVKEAPTVLEDDRASHGSKGSAEQGRLRKLASFTWDRRGAEQNERLPEGVQVTTETVRTADS